MKKLPYNCWFPFAEYVKFLCPYLTSEVWRLKGIDRNGKRHDRLKKKYIETVQDFLFWLHVNPDELQKTVIVTVYYSYLFDISSGETRFCLYTRIHAICFVARSVNLGLEFTVY